MSPELQTIVALFIVALAVAALIRRAVKQRHPHGCGGSCACPTRELKRPQL